MDSSSTVPEYKKLSSFQDRIPGHRKNSRLHPATLVRWCLRGVRLPDGSRVKLQAVRVGCRWLTTDAWFDKFITTLTEAYTGCEDTQSPRSPTQRRRAAEAADRELKAMGI
jgi:Protein of unknown function (DUF1580)